ncbi:hypothetical protein D9611_012354 [Ephemerocybe angulata]|uniref:Uncharacterized protein n=1 Tax=Ephemerocybe angulata TaxID=980116 RepID=A0A8H5FKD0_9AGAR|nr:hypothetical protein D9611_012354 [Tulosesus angulatus]
MEPSREVTPNTTPLSSPQSKIPRRTSSQTQQHPSRKSFVSASRSASTSLAPNRPAPGLMQRTPDVLLRGGKSVTTTLLSHRLLALSVVIIPFIEPTTTNTLSIIIRPTTKCLRSKRPSLSLALDLPVQYLRLVRVLQLLQKVQRIVSLEHQPTGDLTACTRQTAPTRYG